MSGHSNIFIAENLECYLITFLTGIYPNPIAERLGIPAM